MVTETYARIIELERKLAVTKAKVEQVEVKAKALQHEFQSASTRAADLMQQAELADQELATIKAQLANGSA